MMHESDRAEMNPLWEVPWICMHACMCDQCVVIMRVYARMRGENEPEIEEESKGSNG